MNYVMQSAGPGRDPFPEPGTPTEVPPPNEPINVPPVPDSLPGREQEPLEIPIDTPPELPPQPRLRL